MPLSAIRLRRMNTVWLVTDDAGTLFSNGPSELQPAWWGGFFLTRREAREKLKKIRKHYDDPKFCKIRQVELWEVAR